MHECKRAAVSVAMALLDRCNPIRTQGINFSHIANLIKTASLKERVVCFFPALCLRYKSFNVKRWNRDPFKIRFKAQNVAVRIFELFKQF